MNLLVIIDLVLFLILLKYFFDIFKSLKILRHKPELKTNYLNQNKKTIKNL
jgi:hypothetical protein